MRSPEERRRLGLCVAPEEVHVPPQPETLDDRLGLRREPPGGEELRIGMRRQKRRERLEPELEPIGLVLVAPEEQDRPGLGRAAPPA